jgi:hypothetical protein
MPFISSSPVVLSRSMVRSSQCFASQETSLHENAPLTEVKHSPVSPEKLRVMSYNAWLLHEPEADVYKKKSPEALKALADIILKGDANLVMLQEVQSEKALKYFVDKVLNPMSVASHQAPYKYVAYNPVHEARTKGEIPIGQMFLYKEPLKFVKHKVYHAKSLPSITSDKEALLQREVHVAHFTLPLPDGKQQPLLARLDLVSASKTLEPA